MTERRDVLSLFFLLLAVLAWQRGVAAGRGRRCGWWSAAFLAAVLSSLAKAWAVTLPVVLLLLDVWPYRRVKAEGWVRLVREKTPFVLLAFAVAATAGLAQRAAGASVGLDLHPIGSRLAQAGVAVWHSLFHTVWPATLGPIHELDPPLDLAAPRPFLALVGVLAVTAALAHPRVRRRVPGLLVAWLAWLVVLSPVLGCTQAGPQLTADRYTCVASVPLAVLVGAALVARRGRRRGRGGSPCSATREDSARRSATTRRCRPCWSDTSPGARC